MPAPAGPLQGLGQAGFLHLHHGFVFQSFALLAVFDRFSARRRGSIEQGLCKLKADGLAMIAFISFPSESCLPRRE
jgi:hypothetical protein